MKKREQLQLPLQEYPQSGSRIGRAFRQNKTLLYAFLFPFILTYIAYLTRLVYPVGNRCILTIDLYHQYAPFLSELYEKLSGFDSLLYSWNAGLGLNFLALSAYYLISPFNLILLLFPRANLPEAIAFIQVLKVGLCSLTMAWYLRRKFGRDGMGLVLFGTLFALSNYVLSYSWNVMWLDGVLMLPVVAFGLEEMIAGRRYIRYVVALALTITFCYYISWFICLFLVIYFFVAYFSRYPALRFGLLVRKGLKFAFFSLLAAGLSAAVVLPTYTALKLTSAANDVAPSTWSLTFNLFDFLTNHLLVVPLHIRDGLPNIYSGLALLLLVPLYFYIPSIPTRSKIAHLFGLLALFFSFGVNQLDFWWNGGHYPNQLPYRYAFVYVFLILSMGYPVFLRLREVPSRIILGIGMAAAGFVVLADHLGADVMDTATVYLSLVFLVLLAAAFAYARNVKHPRELRVTVLVSVMVAEILVNTFVSIDLLDRTEYYSIRDGFVEDRVRIIDLMDRVEADGSGDFYRVELLEPRTVNDTVLHSYRGVSVFASTAYLETTRVMKALGLHNNGINSYRYSDASAVLESILGIRYLVGKDASYSRSTMEPWMTEGEHTVFRNPYALPVAFMVGAEMEYWNLYKDPFYVQNQFIELATGIKEVQIPLDTEIVTESNLTMTRGSDRNTYSYTKIGSGSCTATLSFTVPATREVCFYLDANQLDFNTEVRFGENDATLRTYDLTRPYMVDLGLVQAGTVVEVKMTYKDVASGQVKLYPAMLDEPKFKQAMALLAEQGLDVDHFSDTRISGTVDVRDAGTLFTSIPYDKGWTVRVDGVEQETSAFADGLLSVELEPGLHQIEMRYLPSGLRDGLMVSGASLVLLVVAILLLHLINRRHPPDEPLSGNWPPLPEWEEADREESPDTDEGEADDLLLEEPLETGRARRRHKIAAGGETEEPQVPQGLRRVILPPAPDESAEESDPSSGLPPILPLSPVDERFVSRDGVIEGDSEPDAESEAAEEPEHVEDTPEDAPHSADTKSAPGSEEEAPERE